MKTKLTFLTTLAAMSGALAMFAQEPPPPPSPEGGRPPGGPPTADRIAEFLKRSDADSDGKISKDEFVNSAKKDSEDRFAKLDANADGYADKAEIEEAGRKMREMAGQRRPEGEGMRRPEGEGGFRPRPGGEGQPGGPRPEGFRRPEGGEGQRPGGMGGSVIVGMIMRMDKDSDGNITKEEFAAGNQEQFDRMDENKDGKVTKEELEAAGRRMREMMGGGRPPGGDGGFRRPGGDGQGTRARPEGEAPKRPEGEAPEAPKAP